MRKLADEITQKNMSERYEKKYMMHTGQASGRRRSVRPAKTWTHTTVGGMRAVIDHVSSPLRAEVSRSLNPFHAYPGPCPGILILITMPIPDRVRASLQLIHCMLNSRQVWPDASSMLQNNIGVYYSAIWWLFGGYRPLPRSGLAVHGHFVGFIHKTVAVLMFWSELKQFACIQSQCHRKLGEQQLSSIGLCGATLIHIAGRPIVCRFIHSLQQTQYVQQMLV